MESTITYDLEATLSAPDGGVLKEIMVTVEIEPADAGVLIYGWQHDGNLGFVEVRGAKTELSLPFAKPQIFIKYLGNLKNVSVSTRGWRENL